MPNMTDLLGMNPATTSLMQRGMDPNMLFMQDNHPLDNISPSSANFDPNMEASYPYPGVGQGGGNPYAMGGGMPDPSMMQGMQPQMPQDPAMAHPPQDPSMGQPQIDPSMQPQPGQDQVVQDVTQLANQGYMPQNEAEIIIQALMDRLKHHSKMEAKGLSALVDQPMNAQPDPMMQ